MGFLIDDLILTPVNLVTWIAEKVKEVTDAELYDESKIKAELTELMMSLEMGDIDEESYQKREKELMERLNYIKKMKENK